MSKKELISSVTIESKIFNIQQQQVMLDRDLAELYQVPVKRLNEQVKRNIDRFPSTFRFQLNNQEKQDLVANCDRLNKLKYSSVNPYAFTEQGVAMLSAVLHSKIAIQVSIQIMTAFVEMRKLIANNASLAQRLDGLENKQINNEHKFEKLFTALEKGDLKPKQGIFYDGQIFDAYVLISNIIRSAKSSIIIIDNYIDDTVLIQLAKKKKNVTVTILTKNISKQLQLDVKKANQQYQNIKIRKFEKAHDRFIIIDMQDVYHIGASLKDLGKKYFAFSKIDKSSVGFIKNIEELL